MLYFPQESLDDIRQSPTLRNIFLELLPKLRKDLRKIYKELGQPLDRALEVKKDIAAAEKMIKEIDKAKAKRKLPKPRK